MNRLAPLLMSVPLAACAAGAAPAPSATPEPAPAQVREASFTWETTSPGAGGRRYRLFVPASHDAARPAPLLVMLHGCTQDPDDFARGTRMNEVAAEHGLLVAYPEQTAAAHPQKCWSWYDPAHQERGRGEPAEVAAVAREVMAAHRVDPARVYVAGVSAGGAMALTLAAAYSELFAAAGSHSGVAYRAAGGVQEALQVMQRGAASSPGLAEALARTAAGRPPLPLIVFHGGADPVVRSVNAEQTAFQWAEASALAGEPLRVQADAAWAPPLGPSPESFHPSRTRFVDGRGRAVVEMWIVPGLGHAWSGGSPEGSYTEARGPDASREMVRFFLEHAREAR
ncbi:MAG TPA: PHB depolymerase family esterase [Longimicrobiaceae bacterium]|nr:PHB depolymerase family esterase [Longimicrobiaceae bacterium]